MKSFNVLHPIGGDVNSFLKRRIYEYEFVCSVEAESINHVFSMCQNDLSEKYASLNKRSTCVGDIIVDADEQKHYFIAPIGFIEIPPSVSQYIDWGNHPKAKELNIVEMCNDLT